MNVEVDMGLCESHGMCAYAAPKVFRLDDEDVLVYDATPPEESRPEVEEAVKVCPARAIRLLGG